ncbi:polysaccharide biosynthesis tyrosine autokinase [Psychrobacter jeotgali]|uniref:polysaccharide biosynthesis tyrosine autokinase n=1 Tax=Psychrobacter jeotgali TaxID=179010 RepID=UPI0019184B82|nr:polysaccharide biosynthesis tyrosine autokinase [Psychrobacter jeotgali]
MNSQTQNKQKSTAEQSNDDIDLMALLLVLLRGWKVVVFFALLGLALGIVYSRYVNPVFKADALIQIEDNTKGLSGLGSNISELLEGSDSSKAQTEAELIRSRMILEPVVELLHLRVRLSNPNIGFIDRVARDSINTQINTSEGVSLRTQDGKVDISQFNVSRAYLNQPFTLVRSGTGFILSNGFDEFKGQLNQSHTFKGTNGQVQITVIDLPDDNYPINIAKQSLQTATDSINAALSVVEKGQQTGIIELSMTGSNQQQVSLILKEIIFSYVDQNQSRGSEETTRTLEFMESQIPVLKKKLEASEAAFNEFRTKYGTIDVEQEAGLLLTETSNIDRQLSELKLKKADLTTYYTEEHPLVIQINDQIEVLNNRKQELENTISELPEVQREFLTLSEDTAIDREIYLNMLKNYQQLQIVKAGQVGYARIIDLPLSNFNIIAPKKLIIWLLATLIGTMLGMLLVLIRGLFRKTVKDPERLEAKTGVPVVATIPRSPLLTRLNKNKKSSSRLLAQADSNSLSYEAIKSLRTNLMFSMPKVGKAGKRAKVILITGESPGVGKSFISSNLSEVFSQLDKKVLIIDADMRLGELHKVFNMTQDNGLADYFIQETDSIVDIVHPTSLDNVDFIPRGQHPRNPTSLLSGGKFNILMAELSDHYDYIIIDSPPVLAASDAMILSQFADQVLMVTRYDTSVEGQLVYAVNQLGKANVEVDGIVLNDVQQGIMSKYSYHYNYAYGNDSQ